MYSSVCGICFSHWRDNSYLYTPHISPHVTKDIKEGVLSGLKVTVFTCVQAFRTRVALFVPLTAPHLHELRMQCVQHLPIHTEHCVGQLMVEHKTQKNGFYVREFDCN